ncbi:hypothetical protein F2Q70_00015210 [Brassica cretica]|uniref:Uncharacterized protein n=1 Tax=Brassica cretica TaxID=69181 RepID=A0A8S9KVV0_BRACR|nr:hypothetical protein F2Q70_00015210 [Brassica cretica]KAF2599720.1 hypothetical protein F2Q68_00008302 [Brassica cretica]
MEPYVIIPRLTALQGTDLNPSPWEETPPHQPLDQLVKTRLVEVLLKCEVSGSSNAKCTNNLPVDVEAFPPTVRALQGTDPNPSPWEETPSHPPVAQLVTACPVGELLKGEVLGSSNAKHINNLHGGVRQVVTKKVYFFYVTTHPAHSEPGSQPWEKTPPHPPVSRSISDNSSSGSVVKE